MYECLIKNYNADGSTSYEYWCDEGRPRCPHIPIPEGAEYLLCHEGVSNEELIFGKNNFEYNWSVTYSDTKWNKSIWDGHIIDRLEYMRRRYGSVVLWKRDDIVMNEDKYLLTKLQACDVLLNEPKILQCESVDGSWFNIDWNSFHVQNLILDKESKYKLRIKPSLVHVPIEFSEVMDMLADGKVNEVFINKEVNLAQAENPLFYLQYQYHDKYSRAVEKHITYDQWKNSVDLKTSLK
ncbi:Uncharacterised protein [Acinetobacter phage MD-2021a]|nr:Uncharacterised protein [Acinetobacter phage MD-2021a]CAH1089029.1 Uncharacterised protein [Acinetobacter phage MD-2021a]